MQFGTSAPCLKNHMKQGVLADTATILSKLIFKGAHLWKEEELRQYYKPDQIMAFSDHCINSPTSTLNLACLVYYP